MVRSLRFSDQEKSLLWERWRQGDGLREIARLLERGPSSVSKVLHRTGGMQPATRTRSSRVLSLEERERGNAGKGNYRTLRATKANVGHGSDDHQGCVYCRTCVASQLVSA